MAISAVTPWASWDRTDRTEKQVLDSTLWEIMKYKSKLLDSIPVGPKIDSTRYEWEYRQANTWTVTGISSHDGNDIVSSGADQTAGITVSAADALKCPIGTILRNKTRATPIGTYQVNELLEVLDNTATNHEGTQLSVRRDRAGKNSGTGSTAHVATDVYEVLYTPKQEGSSAGINEWKAYGILENYTVTMDFYLTQSGSAEARALNLVGTNDFGIQWDDRLMEFTQKLASVHMYGAANPTTVGGSDSQIRQMKGFFNFAAAAGGNVDYTTTTLTEDALNDSFQSILDDGGSSTDNYVIICPPKQARIISSFGADKVRTTWSETRVGRQITTFVSDLGFTAEVIADPVMFSTDLAIVNTRKWRRLPYRPIFKKTWEDGADAKYYRAITEFTMQVVDPLTAHAVFTVLT